MGFVFRRAQAQVAENRIAVPSHVARGAEASASAHGRMGAPDARPAQGRARKLSGFHYQVSKSLPLEKREKAWDAYQKLSEEQKKKLAASKRTRRPTVVSAPPTGKTEVKDINRLVAARAGARWRACCRGKLARVAGTGCARLRRAGATGHSQRREHRPGHADSGVAAASAFDVQLLLNAPDRMSAPPLHRHRPADARAHPAPPPRDNTDNTNTL